MAFPTDDHRGFTRYYRDRICALESDIERKDNTIRRLIIENCDLKARVRTAEEDLRLDLEAPSHVGIVQMIVKKSMVLVKVGRRKRKVVTVGKDINIKELTPHTGVALGGESSHQIQKILSRRVSPLIELLKVEKAPDSTYDMIGGLEKQFQEIREILELPILHPDLFERLGVAQPKSVLLYGPPGNGKTLLARAIAHHTHCTFMRLCGSELVQKHIGEGAKMVRQLFDMARNHQPSIIFIDEIDSIGSYRLGRVHRGHAMLELLHQLDGFESSDKIKIIMATNRIDILDKALLRPGRIGRKIEIPYPNEESRFSILKIHSRKMNLIPDVSLMVIAQKMHGASGAELMAVCTEAGMFAFRERRIHVKMEDFEMAVPKVMKGRQVEKNSFRML